MHDPTRASGGTEVEAIEQAVALERAQRVLEAKLNQTDEGTLQHFPDGKPEILEMLGDLIEGPPAIDQRKPWVPRFERKTEDSIPTSTCRYCGKVKRVTMLVSHTKSCKTKHEMKCVFCAKKVYRFQMRDHLEECAAAKAAV